MIFAKLSGIPITTQISRVSAPANNSGIKVIRTSPIRRSVIHSRMAMETNAVRPACMNAWVTA